MKNSLSKKHVTSPHDKIYNYNYKPQEYSKEKNMFVYIAWNMKEAEIPQLVHQVKENKT